MDFALRRLRASVWLRACAVVAFMAYGGLVALVLARKLSLLWACLVALLSLAAWFFLFWWYPVLERTVRGASRRSRGLALGRLLEGIAIGCVVLVHLLLAIIVVYVARS